MNASHRRWLPAALVLPAMLLAACGSGTAAAPAATPTATTSPATTPAATTPAAPAATTPAATTAPTAETTTTGPERCPTSALAGRLRAGDSGAGQRSATLVLTNRSGRTCRLDGYGGVRLADAAGRALPTTQARDAGTPPRSVILAPGAAGASLLRWTAVPGAGTCPSPASLRVIPPDERSALSVPWSLGPVCGGGRITQGAYRSA